jgi:high-affinity Fe2+/Pb2+ permease
MLLLTTGVIALRRSDTAAGHRGYWLAVLSGGVYAIVSVWHFIEHANGNDPQVAHLFLYVGAAGMIAGAVLGLASARRSRHA